LYFLGGLKGESTQVIIEASRQYQKYIDHFFLPTGVFYNIELSKREKLSYPPLKALLQIVAHSRNKKGRDMVLNSIKNEFIDKRIIIDGPFPGNSFTKQSVWSDQLMIKFDQELLSMVYDTVVKVVQSRKKSEVKLDFQVWNTLPNLRKERY